MLRIGINGFGRIGRRFFRLLAERNKDIVIVAINDLADARTLGHLLKYDSLHGPLRDELRSTENSLLFQGREIPVSQHGNPGEIPWAQLGVDVVVECSGQFKTRDLLTPHLKQGAKKVILSVPPQDSSIPMLVMGVNDSAWPDDDSILSLASCTTNNAAPMIQLIDDLCGIEQAYITTVHSYTSDQSLHDQAHRDLRRARAATQSIIPTTTGAAKALTQIFPHLSDAIGGCGIRVPVPNGSLTDITCNVKRETDIKALNDHFKRSAEGKLKGILHYTEDPIVSVDINNSSYSCTFDSQMTSVIGRMVKVIGWYDNESGYSSRLIDVLSLMLEKNIV
jgi:glyceraldehyde 3-phosphate dehydrogenase